MERRITTVDDRSTNSTSGAGTSMALPKDVFRKSHGPMGEYGNGE